MRIVIEQDDGKQLALETALMVIPPGHTALICPADKDFFVSEKHKQQIKQELSALGIRAVVVQIPVHVWAIADATA